MAHATLDPDVRYRRLQQRLDRMPTGAPDSEAFRAILRLLFSPDEAELAARMPTLCSLRSLARRFDRDIDELDETVTSMSRRGLVIDLEHNGHRQVMLAPVVVGFYEYTFMRVGENAPPKELAHLFDDYMHGDDADFPHAVFRSNVQIMRALVQEEALADQPEVEVLDWERTSHIIQSAPSVAVATCPCRNHATMLDKACGAPLRACLSFGDGADALVRMGLAEPITNAEAAQIVRECKADGLAQTADNVQQHVGYICNCCRDCCGLMQAVRGAGITDAVVSSNWVAETDFTNCRGCKKCFRRCPVEAISIIDNEGKGRRPYWSVVDPELCIGCGVCTDVCKWNGRYLRPTERRVFTPATAIDKMIAMAVERGKLGDLLVDTFDGVGPHMIARVVQALERTPPATALRAVEPLRSVFLKGVLVAVHAA